MPEIINQSESKPIENHENDAQQSQDYDYALIETCLRKTFFSMTGVNQKTAESSEIDTTAKAPCPPPHKKLKI